MALPEWLADIGKAADDLGYGILNISPDSITLVGRQDEVTIVLESHFLNGDLLRSRLVKIPHRSGSSYTSAYEQSTPA